MITEGQLFKEARERNGYTQGQVAVKLGLKSPQFISNVERNLAKVPSAKLKKLKPLLGEHALKRMIDVRVVAYRKELRAELK